jgi:hypothetical protein
MSRAALGRSNHLYSRYRGSFLGTKKPGREVNHAPPSSVMLEMCVYIHPPHTHTSHGMVFLLNTVECTFSYLVWKRIQIVVSACQCVRNKSSSNSHSTGTWKIRGVCSKNVSHGVFIVAMEVLDRTLSSETGYPHWDLSLYQHSPTNISWYYIKLMKSLTDIKLVILFIVYVRW